MRRAWVVALLVGCGGGKAGAGAGADASAGADAGADAGAGAGAGADADAGADGGGAAVEGGFGVAEGGLASGRSFPDTTATIAILADQLPSMTAAQTMFAATHYVGTQKQELAATQALRAINPKFLVLHYHLSMWQSAPSVDFLVPSVVDGGVDGVTWGNDYPTVATHEDWFWHDADGGRVPSNVDGKLLMNVSVADFQAYWAQSLEAQVQAGQYDAIFFDSASPPLLQAECSGTDPRLAGTAARYTSFPELDGGTWIDAWQTWMSALNTTLGARGIPLIPNTSAFITGWDNTNYGLTAGIFAEGFAGTDFAETDWQASTNELLTLAAAGKIIMLQNYLSDASDVATRMYYLGNYLLVKNQSTYLDYFAGGPLEWYPEWTVDLGAPTGPAPTAIVSLLTDGVYRRDFAKGSVLVNPSSSPVTVSLGATYQQVTPSGGGAVDSNGDEPGSLTMMGVTSVTVAATSAAIVLH